MKRTKEESPTLPSRFQNGERVRVSFMPEIESRIRAIKFTATSVLYDLDIWPPNDPGNGEGLVHTKIYNIESVFIIPLSDNIEKSS